MNTNQKIHELITTLIQKGLDDDQIAEVCANIGEEAFELFVNQAKTELGEEELQSLETVTSEEEAHERLKEIYQAKTGKDAQEEISMLIDKQVDAYLQGEDSTPDPSGTAQ
jgi:hypothetical protein